jgi:hypothetical protein
MSGGDNLDFEIRPNPAPVSDAERSTLLANPGFGRIFTDHMVTIRYAEGKNWKRMAGYWASKGWKVTYYGTEDQLLTGGTRRG